MNKRLAELDEIMGQANFWDDPKGAQAVSQERTRLGDKLSAWNALDNEGEEISLLLDMALEEGDESQVPELGNKIKALSHALDLYEVKRTLSGAHDSSNAIVDIHAGAGGTESQDWAQMLMRMYLRYADRNGFKTQIVDMLDGDEAGIKSVTFTVAGSHAFGLMRSEVGIHRLVRISPFDSSGRRHTSFASCDVMPELDDDNLIEINPDDLKVDTYRSSGAGGQHVNTTESAIRITHVPTGIIVQCQNERSQIKNRDRAMKMLKAKLYVLKQEEQMAKLNGIRGEVKDIAWGSQIRSYVFHPYSMVKDHRTNEEVGNVQGVMDGALDNFMNAYLVWAARKDA
jgi:peptide chain release factor 2